MKKAFPLIYHDLRSISNVKMNQDTRNYHATYETRFFTFQELGKNYRLYLHINKSRNAYHLVWKEINGLDQVINLITLEAMLDKVNEEAPSFLLFHLDLFKECKNKTY